MIFLLQIMLYKVYVYCKQVVKMPVKASAEKRELILKIYKYFGAESKRKAPFYAWNIKSLIELYKLWTLAVHF